MAICEQPVHITNTYRQNYFRIVPVVGVGPTDTSTVVSSSNVSISQNRGVVWGLSMGWDVRDTSLTTNITFTNNNQITFGLGVNF